MTFELSKIANTHTYLHTYMFNSNNQGRKDCPFESGRDVEKDGGREPKRLGEEMGRGK